MATQIVMDNSGDSRQFRPLGLKGSLGSRGTLQTADGCGFGGSPYPSGEPVITRRFDPTAEETLFFPRLVGG